MNRGRRAGPWAALGLLAATSLARSAGAPPIVRVYVAGSAEAVSGSRDAIQDLCARSNVAVVVRDAAGADEALLATSHAPGLADAYVDLRADTPPRVVVVDGETRQDLERRTLPEGASLEISIETMAHVVCAAVESSLAARAAAAAAAPAPPVAAAAAPAPPVARERVVEPESVASEPERPERDERWQARASVFGSGASFGAGLRAGLGAGLGLNQGRATWHFGAFLGVIGYPSAGVESADALASVALLGIRALPMLEWQAAPEVTPFIGIGGGGDWIQVSGERPPPGAISSPSDTSFDPVASSMVGVRVLLGRGMTALLAFETDVDLGRHRYITQTPSGSASIFEPARVRPMALAGLSLSLGSGSDEPSASRARREARR